jgi:hypothetical protein
MMDAKQTINLIRKVRKQLQKDPPPDLDGGLLKQIMDVLVWSQILLKDICEASELEAVRLPEPGTPEARVLASNAILRRSLDDAMSSSDFRRDFWAGRFERARDLLRSTPYWHDYAAIMANGTVDPHETDTYGGVLSLAAHRVEVAEKKARAVLACWKRVQMGTPEQQQDAKIRLDALLAQLDEVEPIEVKTSKCHYCGAMTSMRAYLAESIAKGCACVYPSCCAQCVGQWEPIPVSDCSEELLQAARAEGEKP